MTVSTQVIWAFETPTPQEITLINQELEVLKNQGATDGSYTQEIVSNGTMFIRPWTTLNDANNWITYLSSYNPVSAIVVQ